MKNITTFDSFKINESKDLEVEKIHFYKIQQTTKYEAAHAMILKDTGIELPSYFHSEDELIEFFNNYNKETKEKKNGILIVGVIANGQEYNFNCK